MHFTGSAEEPPGGHDVGAIWPWQSGSHIRLGRSQEAGLDAGRPVGYCPESGRLQDSGAGALERTPAHAVRAATPGRRRADAASRGGMTQRPSARCALLRRAAPCQALQDGTGDTGPARRARAAGPCPMPLRPRPLPLLQRCPCLAIMAYHASASVPSRPRKLHSTCRGVPKVLTCPVTTEAACPSTWVLLASAQSIQSPS